MNLSIINRCNLDCQHCFQGSYKYGKEEKMDVDTVKEIMKWYDSYEPIGILGGEPTLHPNLIEIIKTITGRRVPVSLFTNLTNNVELTKKLLKIVNMDFLININHEGIYGDNFRKNISLIYNREVETLWRYNSAVFLSYTFLDYRNDEDYLYRLIGEDDNNIIKGVRLSHNIPSWDENVPTQESLDISEDVLRVIENLHQKNPKLNIFFDCPINQCIINPEVYEKIKDIIMAPNNLLVCEQPVADVYPNLSTSWCSKFKNNKDMTVDNILDYRNYSSFLNKMMRMKFEYERNNSLACNYKECDNYKCKGLCPALNEVYK
jgi:organic radical activating enzyme